MGEQVGTEKSKSEWASSSFFVLAMTDIGPVPHTLQPDTLQP